MDSSVVIGVAVSGVDEVLVSRMERDVWVLVLGSLSRLQTKADIQCASQPFNVVLVGISRTSMALLRDAPSLDPFQGMLEGDSLVGFLLELFPQTQGLAHCQLHGALVH
jgi:hypothetical protein